MHFVKSPCVRQGAAIKDVENCCGNSASLLDTDRLNAQSLNLPLPLKYYNASLGIKPKHVLNKLAEGLQQITQVLHILNSARNNSN